VAVVAVLLLMPRALPCSPWRTRGSRRSFTCSTD